MAIQKLENQIVEKGFFEEVIDTEVSRRQMFGALGGSLFAAMAISAMTSEKAYAAADEEPPITMNTVKFDGSTEKNITFEYPAQVRFEAQPDAYGNLALVSQPIEFKNLSTRELVLESITPTVASGWSLVSDASTASGSSRMMSLNFESSGESVNTPTSNSAKATGSSTAWTMAIPTYSEELSKISVSATGAMKNVAEGVLSDEAYKSVGSVKWKIGLNTITNQFLDVLYKLEAKVTELETANQTLQQNYTNKAAALQAIVDSGVSSNGIFPLGNSAPSTRKLWVDKSVGGNGALKYKQNTTWNPGRYVWA